MQTRRRKRRSYFKPISLQKWNTQSLHLIHLILRLGFYLFTFTILGWGGLAFAQAPTTAKIAFTSMRDGNREIYLMDTDGKNQINLTQHPAEDSSSAWSPDGKLIAFVSNRDGKSDIYLMNADGQNVRKLFGNLDFGINQSPAWSPTGTRIAFTHQEGRAAPFGGIVIKGGIPKIYIVNADGSNPTPITENPETLDLTPSWPPDGRQIAFASIRFVAGGPISEIHIVDLQTKRIRPLITNGWNSSPAWSPDGKTIAFVRDDRLPNIYVIDSNGRNPVRLTNGLSPAWSPNGKHLLFSKVMGEGNTHNPHTEIFVMDADGSNQRQLTNSIGGNRGGNWFDPAILAVDLKDKLLTTWGKLKKGTH